MLRTVLVGLCCLLLVVSLFGANLVVATDRGPLDSDHTKESLEEAEIYDHIQVEIVETILAEEAPDEIDALGIDFERVIERAISTEWLQGETERNIDAVHAYLDGSEDSLELYVEPGTLEEPAATALREEFDELSYSNAGIDRLDTMLADEASYESERMVLRSDVLAEQDATAESGFGQPTLAAMVESEAGYEAEQAKLYETMTDEAMADLEARNGFGDDRLANMLADEDGLAAEQMEFREERKAEIQEETERELSDEELEEAYQDQREDIIAESTDSLTDELDEEIDDAPIDTEPHVSAIAGIVAEGLATDMSYSTFTEKYHDAVDDLESDILTHVAEETHEYEDEIREGFEAELADSEVPTELHEDVEPVIDLTVEAVTNHWTYDAFIEEYEQVGSDLEDAIAAHMWENRADHQAELDEAIANELELAQLPGPLEAQVDEYVTIGLEAVLTDMSYERFATEIDAQEDELSAAMVEHLFDSDDGIPERVDFGEDMEDEMATELEHAQTATTIVGLLSVVLPAVSALLLGGVYFLSSNAVLTSVLGGIVSMIVGLGSYAIATIVPSQLADEIDAMDVPANLATAIQEVVYAMFAPLSSQSILLTGIGIGLIGVGVALHTGLDETVREALSNYSE